MATATERRAVIFDVDGTMVDNRRFHEAAWLELGRRRGLPITTAFYRARMHSRSNRDIARLLLGDDVDAQAAAALSDQKETIYRDSYRPHLREIAGLAALLAGLRAAGVPCAAVSNSPAANVDMVLDTLAVRTFFRAVIDRDQAARGKPDPEMFLAAAARLGVAPARTLVFEDSVSGFAAAEAAGTPYVVVTAGAAPEELVHARQPAGVIADFSGVTVDAIDAWLEQPAG